MPIVKEIKFDGYIFRSKIEAQHYLFFKTLGLDCYYERETLSLVKNDGKIINYLPDFFLPDLDSYVEIKLDKSPTVDECMKCYMVALQTNKDCYLFYEVIGKKNVNAYKYCAGSGAFIPQNRWTECPKCKTFDITYKGLVCEMQCGCCSKNRDDLANTDSFSLKEAVMRVRSERFGA